MYEAVNRVKNAASFQMISPRCYLADTSDRRSSTLVEEKRGKSRELGEKRPIYRWPGWECIGRRTRTLLSCPEGLGPLTVTGLMAAKSQNLDHSNTTEAGGSARETDNKRGTKAHAWRK